MKKTPLTALQKPAPCLPPRRQPRRQPRLLSRCQLCLPPRGARAAFTLLEILVAVAIAAVVFVGMNLLVLSMSELWGRNSDLRLFELHTRNVTRFVERELARAVLPPAVLSTATAPAVKEVRLPAGATEELLTCEFSGGSRLCAWPQRPLPNVVCSLAVRDGAGLVLLWHSRLELDFDDDAPRETVISPLVTAMSYLYYDPEFKNWKTETAFQKDANGAGLVPQRLKLTFAYSGRTIETVVNLPGLGQGQPML
ncbi:MAG: prepilin-type N-terminal cleavage/methylation domain-containing protein [Opitutaceae bacterium]|jgi:prepilin-type N-terminal cleavage/methylation domain-containing protein|nr:prepilin-type N-terminal cleavage/methylation domain-containing protein [Opitutaceae bacterium]